MTVEERLDKDTQIHWSSGTMAESMAHRQLHVDMTVGQYQIQGLYLLLPLTNPIQVNDDLTMTHAWVFRGRVTVPSITISKFNLSRLKFRPTTAPGSPTVGDMYLDQGDLALRIYTATGWQRIVYSWPFAHAQAQAKIAGAVKTYAFGQSQARIKGLGLAFAQAKAEIYKPGTERRGFGQARAFITSPYVVVTWHGWGQAQALLNRHWGFGQARAKIV